MNISSRNSSQALKYHHDLEVSSSFFAVGIWLSYCRSPIPISVANFCSNSQFYSITLLLSLKPLKQLGLPHATEKDFVNKIKQEDACSELRKIKLTRTAKRIALAQAKAAAAKAGVTAEMKEMVPSASTSAETLFAPRHLVRSNQTSSPLHPSLVPKIGSSVKPSLPPDTARNATAAPAGPVIAAQVPTPSPAPMPATSSSSWNPTLKTALTMSCVR
jgi:hypothetical protein